MAWDNVGTIVGNVTRDPEHKVTAGGMSITNFGLAWNKRKQDGEDETSFFDISCFRALADNVAASVNKGDRVVVYGHFQQDRWTTPEGETRSKVSFVADDVAPSLKWASATINKNPREGGSGGSSQASAPAAPAYDPGGEPF
jgi:single-strand DNA-binding protein